jgi:hypothetical protein
VLDLAQGSKDDEPARGGGSIWQSEEKQQEGRLPITTSGAEVWSVDGFGRIWYCLISPGGGWAMARFWGREGTRTMKG